MNRKCIKVAKANNYKSLCIRHTFVKRENYKKRVVAIAVSTMLLFALTACGKDKETDIDSSTSYKNRLYSSYNLHIILAEGRCRV